MDKLKGRTLISLLILIQLNWITARSGNPEDLIPDVLDCLPPHKITGEYGRGLPINFGSLVTPLQANATPTSITWPSEKRHLYVMMMLDMDGPTRENPIHSPVIHWLIGNIPGDCWRCEGTTLLALYSQPHPQLGAGLHRYVYLVYKQPGGANARITFTEPVIQTLGPSESRRHFNYRNFARKYSLGSAYAVNYFLSTFVPPICTDQETCE